MPDKKLYNASTLNIIPGIPKNNLIGAIKEKMMGLTY
jgi:hypothetical protein